MTSAAADPELLRKLAEAQASAEQASAEITEDLRATETELAEEARLAKEANERLSRELDEQVEQRQAAQADESKHRWPAQQSSAVDEHQFGFEQAEPGQPGRHAAVENQELPSPSGSAELRTRQRQRAEEEFDDDDFSNNSWLS